ncbi:MAG TPA: tetratricopeptide repeat protein [Caulobacteraceae bacterium]
MSARVGAMLAVLLSVAGTAFAGPLEDGTAALAKGDYAGALRLLNPLAAGGNPAAQYEIATMYVGGHGVPTNDATAAAWLQKSAAQGDAHAELLLALFYARGQGVPQDDKLGLAWLDKAAAQSGADAQGQLRGIYYYNRGAYDRGVALTPEQVAAKALPGLRKLADSGDAMAQLALGSIYEQGRGVTKDEAQAAVWYRRAADQGVSNAQIALAGMYRDGRGVAKDPAAAAYWLSAAKAQNASKPAAAQVRPSGKKPG